MVLLRKDNIKGTIVVSMITILIMMVIIGCVSYTQYKQNYYQMNREIAGIIGKLIQDYPEEENKIVKSLNQVEQEEIQKGMQILQKYGWDMKENVYFKSLENLLQENLMLNVFVIGILGILLLIIFLTYLIIKDKKIEEITEYIKRVQKKDYSLKIKDNTEGELSDLRNELYKITVMLKEQAEQLSKDKKQLENSISDISHQLKTPLTSISVMIDILKDNQNVPEEKKQEFLFEVARQLEWINWLVISLLKLSKLDAGTIQLKQEKVSVKQLITEVIRNLSIPIEIKNQTITINGKEDVYFIGDYEWSLEAILNVVKNCLEHTQEGKNVEISFIENSLYTQIVIKDEGVGIDQKDLPHIFERFYKGKNSSKDNIGIGLALAQSIIQKQGGDIGVKSELGKGSTFTIQFFKGVI